MQSIKAKSQTLSYITTAFMSSTSKPFVMYLEQPKVHYKFPYVVLPSLTAIDNKYKTFKDFAPKCTGSVIKPFLKDVYKTAAFQLF